MSIATKPPISSTQQGMRRIWKVPTSKARWVWLAIAILFYGGIYAWYFYAFKTQPFPGPFNDPLRIFGSIAFVLVLSTAAYSLRRRFVRGLPGRAQDWLWMHTWIGIAAVLIALLHENYAHITHDYCQNLSCFTRSAAGTSALYALIVLVASGIIGRLVDVWQAHVIARDASGNGVGIVQAIEGRILELEYTVERLCAGKTEPFQQYCIQSLDSGSSLPTAVPAVSPREQNDFQRAYEVLLARSWLVQSLQRQKLARLVIRTWRTIHILIACLALLVICYHAVMELLMNVFHVIKPG